MNATTHAVWDRRFFSQIIEAMADGVFTLDRSGAISSWNPSMERITGYTAAEALGRTCTLLQCSSCFGKSCPASLKACGLLQHGRSEHKECLVRHKGGYDVPVIKNARAVHDDDGTIIGVVETLTDLTELKKARLKSEEANRLLGQKHRLGSIIGKSRAMLQVFAAIQAAAASQATVLIHGESGTGKELVARAIHHHGPQPDRPMVSVNCAALSESLLESELFGHVKGAFTGALRDRQGRFEEADGGTVFLDEIGDISPFIQVKLLRVLQEHTFERVGESRPRRVTLRVIAATHRDLYQRVQEGRLRQDLYYRLKVFPIHLPPLRERREDIPLLVNHFVADQNRKTGKRIVGLDPAALQRVMDHTWPGNVRELENAIEHAFVLCRRDQIDIGDLPLEIRQPECLPAAATPIPAGRGRAAGLTAARLHTLLDECGWNKAEAGRRLGLSRTAIWKYMKKWGIPLQPPRAD